MKTHVWKEGNVPEFCLSDEQQTYLETSGYSGVSGWPSTTPRPRHKCVPQGTIQRQGTIYGSLLQLTVEGDKEEEVRKQVWLEEEGISEKCHQDSISYISISCLIKTCPVLLPWDQSSYPVSIRKRGKKDMQPWDFFDVRLPASHFRLANADLLPFYIWLSM